MDRSSTNEKLIVVLEHWIAHNHGHREEYAKWAATARMEGLTAVADQIEAAATAAGQADEQLRKALKTLEVIER